MSCPNLNVSKQLTARSFWEANSGLASGDLTSVYTFRLSTHPIFLDDYATANT